MLYYQSHLKHKELSEIVKQQVGHDETTIDASTVTPTKTQQRMLPKFIQSAQKGRKKALSTFDEPNKDPGNKAFLRPLDSINTIKEVSFDDYSRTGYSSNKNFASPLKNHPILGLGQSRHSVLEKATPSQKTTSMDYRSIQLNKSVVKEAPLQLKQEEDILTLPQVNNRMVSPVAAVKVITSESPFMQIGSKIKSMFGNFFRAEEKANRSYEEAVHTLNSYRA